MTARRFHTLSVLTVIFGLIVFFSDLSRFSYIRAVVGFVNSLVAPVLKFKEHTVSELREEIGAYLHRIDVEKENVKLRRRLRSMLLVERELEACMSELSEMEKKLGITSAFGRLNYNVARIVYHDPTGFDLFVIITGGKNRGLKEGDLVVTGDAVLGVVETVFGSTSRVITLFNDKFSATAVLEGKRKRYIYRGGYPEGSLLHVNVEDEVKKGEKVYLISLKGKLPPFLIGEVKEIGRGKDPFFKEVKVKPISVPRAEEFVFVIRRGG